jgi:hypothetical protein
MPVSLPKNNDVYKALTILAIEKTLLDVGKAVYDKVISTLEKNYHCYLTDCYEHPEYLSEILKQLYGDSYNEIIESINKKLEEFSNKEPIERFLQVIHQ